MNNKLVATLFVTVFIAALLLTGAAARNPAQAEVVPVPLLGRDSASAPQDVPETLVAEGVAGYDMAIPKLFWFYQPPCIPTRGRSPAVDYVETISRIATFGGLVRTLYSEEVDSVCTQQILDIRSNIVADDDYVYWTSYSYAGVVRLSTSANIGDAPELLSSAVSGYTRLTQDDDYVYALSETGGIWRISKADGAALAHAASPGASPHNFQTDGKYLYWISGGNLQRVTMDNPAITTIASGVTGYYPEGSRLVYCDLTPPPTCHYTENVFIGQGDQVLRYDNLTGSSDIIYTSTDSSASVYSLVTTYTGGLFGSADFFFLESREVSCDMFCTYQDVLIRTDRSSGGAVDILHQITSFPSVQQAADDLKTDGTFLFWQEQGALKRLSNAAAALPEINLKATGVEVTQGIQDIFNSVRLIENRRTFVRLYVRSDGDPVPGVTAYLYRTDSLGQALEGPLIPVNPVGQQITVQSWPNRTKLNDSFLFELPWSWTTGSLYLRAVLNPNKFPLEPNHEDNVVLEGPLAFQPSPRLQVQFVSFGYVLNNQFYYPRLVDDVFQIYSWIRRVYPLASAPGSASDPSPGFRPNLWIIGDDALGSYVDRSAPECATMYPDPDDRSLCASAYTNNRLKALRVENGVPANVFMYGMISDGGGWPRGQASGSVSSGPTGVACCGSGSWDLDGSYADWYAGHEIGHTLGRQHPSENADNPSTPGVFEGCGHSPSDPSYPYALAKISNGYAEGFDPGDPGLNPSLQMQIYPGIFWYDIMSYCPNLWISDYTYNAMYDYMMAHPTRNALAASSASPGIEGDFLSVFGNISLDNDVAIIHHLRRLSSVPSIPELVAGTDDYRIRLLDAGSAVLADYAFSPEVVQDSDEPMVSFGQVVTFTAGAAQLQIIQGPADQVLTSYSFSANAPVLSDVALQGAGNPVSGTATLAWNASDADDDPLSFDVLYSADGGASFQPLHMGLSGNSAQIDTAQLGGSANAVLRVIASDGVHSAQDDTDPFTMADKPPQPYILSPADGTQVHYGQLVNFSGQALDAQDGSVASANLVWGSQHGQLGTGPLLSSSDLPVGVNYITLTATNSVGLSAYATISVTVDDDLDWPGPTLSVGPTQVEWHVSFGETQTQTAQLSISNAGLGDLNWEAAHDASWLALSALTGTVPYTLTLSANPSGIADGTAVSTTLRVTAPAFSGHLTETIAVPVGLTVGNVYRKPHGMFDYVIYLPLLLR
jgi:hypothetical protein